MTAAGALRRFGALPRYSREFDSIQRKECPMKTCPVCGARCFDDMAVCYGCLHDFSRPALAENDDAADALQGVSRFGEALEDDCDIDDADEGRLEPVPAAAAGDAPSPCVSCSCGEGGQTAFMPVPMVTVVARGKASASTPEPTFAASDGAAVFEIRIPHGSSVVLRAH